MTRLVPQRQELRRIASADFPKTLVILIPGIRTIGPEEWRIRPEEGQHPWYRLLPDDALPSPAIYVFDYILDVAFDPSSLSSLLDQGHELVEATTKLKEVEQYRNCPIVFIAHSLGGLLLKQGISSAFEAISIMRSFLSSIGSIIFMGTPHCTSSLAEDWKPAQMLLGRRSRRSSFSVEDVKRLSSLCLRFEQAVENIPLMSVCETRPVQRPGPFKTPKVLVEKEFCRMKLDREVFLETDSDHHDVCKIDPRSAAFSRIQNFLLASPTFPSAAKSLPPRKSDVGSAPALFNFHTSSKDPRLPCHIIPSKNEVFCGREDVLEQMRYELLPTTGNSRKLRTFALCGPGGMGKSQAAVEFAHRHADKFNAIFLVHAESASTLANDFGRIAEDLGLLLEASAEGRDQVVSRELVKSWLANPVYSYSRPTTAPENKCPWLIIFDSLNDTDSIADFWPPVGCSGSVLVTSRDHLAKTPAYSVSSGFELGPLNIREASDLLLKATWRENDLGEQEASILVAKRLNAVPLALTQMAGVMVRQGLTFTEFLQRYEEEESRDALFNMYLKRWISKKKSYSHTLASVWALDQLKTSSGLLDVISFLAPQGIPEVLLTSMMGTVYLSAYPQTLTEYQDARAELFRSSLISKAKTSSKLNIHSLIQEAVRSKMTLDRSTQVFSTAADLCWSVWPRAGYGVRRSIDRWNLCGDLSPHVTCLKDHYVRSTSQKKAIWATNLNFVDLLNEFGWYLQELSRMKEAHEFFDIALASMRQLREQNGKTEPGRPENERARFILAETHRNMAGLSTSINDGEQALYHYKVYNGMLREGQKFAYHERLVSSMFNVGISFTMQGQFADSVPWYKEALEEAEKINAPEDPHQATNAKSLSLTNWALSCWLANRPDEALNHLLVALKERENVFGRDDRDSMITGRILFGLGNVRRTLGFFDESLAYHKRALLHFKETVGPYHHRTGNSCFKVAQGYLDRRTNLEEAHVLLEQALKVFDGREHYQAERARVLILKGSLCDALGQGKQAVTCREEAVLIYYQVNKGDRKNPGDLTLDDFSKSVHVWGR